jgi:hypothetical protein
MEGTSYCMYRRDKCIKDVSGNLKEIKTLRKPRCIWDGNFKKKGS